MPLSTLPQELILAVGDNLPVASLSCLLRTCHSLHQLFGPALADRITTEQLASTILQRGIRNNHLPTVHLALAHEAAWHTWDEGGRCYCALAEACRLNHLDIVDTLIKHYGPTILTDNQDPEGSYCHINPLEVAIRCNNLPLTTLLLEGGAPATRTVTYLSDKSPLDYAGKYGSAEIAEVLIKHGAEVVHAGRSLCYAVESGRWGVADVLLREGVSVWVRELPWTHSCCLGESSAEDIAAWVASGEAQMQRCMDAAIARRERGLKEMDADTFSRVE